MTALAAMIRDAGTQARLGRVFADEADAILRARIKAGARNPFHAAALVAVDLEAIGRPGLIPWVLAAAVDLDEGDA